MLKILHLLIWVAVWFGVGDSLANLVISLKGAAMHSQKSHQISYKAFSSYLTSPVK